jgi:DNA repair protein RecN (Recombination protein N)
MLRFLSIRDFVIVEQLELEFTDGFTILTGETGAGKSILIDALAFTLGERSDAGIVRQGAKQAEICAEFDAGRPLEAWLAEHELVSDEGGCMLRRVIDASGRSRGFINGRSATLAQLREAGEFLVDIHGQHAHQSMLKSDAQRALLDGHAGLSDEVRDVGAAYKRYKQLRDSLAATESGARELEAERDRISWTVDELSRLAPREGEWEEVQKEHTRLAHAASLIEGVQAAVAALTEEEGAVLGALASVVGKLDALADYDPSLKSVIEGVQGARIQVQEASRDLSQYLRRADLDPARLAEVEARVEALHSAARKFRTTPSQLHAELERNNARLAELKLSTDIEALKRELTEAEQKYLTAGKALSTKRLRAAKKLSVQVTESMQTLALSGGKFEIALQQLDEGGAYGLERIEFLVAGHAGVEPRSLSKVASGGELSRISLAIQVITSKAAKVPVLIFDEVDSGIGGAVAEVVGRLLKELGRERQVLCVTHLPQVASQGDQHWLVGKSAQKGVTRSTLTVLDAAGRVDEIARMLGGTEITATTKKAAKEMLAA